MTFQEALPTVAPLLLIDLILVIVVLNDLYRREPQRVWGPKWLWAILSLNLLGAVAYFVIGRRD